MTLSGAAGQRVRVVPCDFLTAARKKPRANRHHRWCYSQGVRAVRIITRVGATVVSGQYKMPSANQVNPRTNVPQ